MNRFKLTITFCVLALALVGCAGSDGAGDKEQAEAAPAQRSVRVETLVLDPTGFEDVVELTGSVGATDDATLSAQASGTVVSLAERGRFVRAGQSIAQINPGLARAAVQQAEAQVASAKSAFALAQDNFNRQEPLYADSIISPIEFENVRSQLNQARAQVRQAEAVLAQTQQQLRNTLVITPFSGTVEERFVERGEQVAPGTPIARVVNTGRVKVEAGVPERYASDVVVGTPVEVSFNAYGGATRPARVSFVGRAVDPANRTFPVEIELSNPDGQLKPEMVATVYLTREQMEGVLVIPRAAVVRDEQGTSVFVVDQAGSEPTATRRVVELGPSYGENVVVVVGLAGGDEVVVLGQNNLTEGDVVQVVRQHENALAASS